MSKKMVVTPRKSPRLVEGTSTDEVHAPSFNILTQTPSSKIVETLARGGSSLLKDQKEKKNEAKNRVSPVNQKGKKRKGKIVETPFSDSDFHHSQRYATIIWHYEKTKNEDGAISKSEVTGTVASKFGRPRIAKEHVPDTTNYHTPRPRTRNLR
ncbi:hypothetical protein H5410_023514 [Solanum commersonii]|uniref:Uncharacterized protein n=1 Tax=Solanum commersonii TaxID=4109 RepID=A0A9J5ZH26_SOLCO|nr:hypothetical protein H5410_023514 [Solanum commersonii]